MKEVPSHVREAVTTRVMRDLNPSLQVVWLKVILAAIIGSLTSLFVCGQFGLGLTNFAETFNSHLHHHTHPYVCSLICGGIFAVFPVTILRLLFCSPLQFRAIIQRYWYVLLIGFGGIGGVLASQGHHSVDFISFSMWVFAALFVAHVFSRLLNLLFPQIDLSRFLGFDRVSL